MADDRNEDRVLGADDLRALADVRAALDGVEREQGRVLEERRRLRQRLDGLLEALSGNGVALSFDSDGGLSDAGGAVDRLLGIGSRELVSSFEDIAPAPTREALAEANRKVSAGGVTLAESDGVLRCGGVEHAFQWIHVPREDDAGEQVGVDAVGLPVTSVVEEAGDSAAGDPFDALVLETAQHIIDEPGDASIERALAAFGELLGADRLVINSYDEDDRKFSVRASWLSNDTKPLAVETRGISISEIPWAYAQLGAGDLVAISEAADLSADAVAEKRLYAADGVKTSLLIPILRNDVLSGFLSVQSADVERHWSDAEQGQARRLGILLSGALAQAASAVELEAACTDADEAVAQADDARRTAESAEARAREIRQRVEEATAEAEESRARVADLESELETARDEARAGRELSESVEKRVRDAEDAADDVRSELDAAKQEATTSRRELDELRDGAERAQRRSEDTAADALAVRKALEDARAELEEARREAAEVRAERSEDDAEAADSSVPDPEATLEIDIVPEAAADSDADTTREEEPAREADPPEEAPILEADSEADAEPIAEADSEADAEPIAEADSAGDSEPAELDPLPVFDLDIDDEFPEDTSPDLESEPEAAEIDGEADTETVELGEFELDATVESRSDDFDPDATLEIDPLKLAAKADPGAAADGGASDSPAEIELTQTPESQDGDLPRALGLDEILERTQTAEVLSSDDEDIGIGDQPESASGVEETVEVSPPQFLDTDDPEIAADSTPDASEPTDGAVEGDEADDPVVDDDESPESADESSESDDESPESDDVAREVEAARRMARQVAGKDDDDAAATIDDRATPAPTAPAVPDLPGIDPSVGLQDVGGNVELYRNLLSKFRQDYLGASAKIESAIAKGNIEVAHLLLHAIKGVAGMLGAQRVRSTAEDLETNLIGSDETTTQAALGAFNEALDEALESIARLDGGAELPPDEPPDAPDADSHVSDPMVLRSYLSGLRQHLLAEKPKQCQLVMREITARTWPGEFNDQVNELARLISAAEFEAARQTFDTLMSMFRDD